MKRSSTLVIILAAAACAEPVREPTLEETSAELTRVAAGRLLDQATFGARPHKGTGTPALDTIEHVVANGIGPTITAQLDQASGTFARTPARPAGDCDGPFDQAFDLGTQFFVAALRAPDQLRLRVMFALHQILVVGEGGINENRNTCNSERRDAMRGYLNALRTGAFDNYRELLETITLDPAMGTFLDMANNVAFDSDGTRITPNENFARELLQLFTLGTSLLAEDGTVLTDAAGKPRPTYSEANVQAFARTLTGWTYAGTCPGIGGKNGASYSGPMHPCQVNHDDRSAQLLRYTGVVANGQTTAGATARVHLEEALDNIFNHPNLPPFISKQLIQHLVTSNPSRAYVRRVVEVFKDDGTTAHKRGNLRAVVRAILLDAEARDTPFPVAGRLRAPAEMITRILRSLGTTIDPAIAQDRFLDSHSAALGQSIPRPPSVFSYYPPGNPLPGNATKVAPEFGLLDTGTTAGRANFMHALLHGNQFAAKGLRFDLADVPDTSPALLAWIDERWLHGTMSTTLRTQLTAALEDPDANTALRRKQLALYLAALSPEFQIQR